MDGLIGLDWGTSSLRAYRLDGDGVVHELREQPWGIRELPEGGFDAALVRMTEGWPELPMLACGMVGSRGGWAETAYLELPADVAQLAHGLGMVQAADGRHVHIVPGLHDQHGPDVMRGEETQLVGALARFPEWAARSTWILPGTHSKWVSVREGAIDDFSTLMTGELFAVLSRHSILGNTPELPIDDPDAFVRGVISARDSGASGALSRLFSARTLMLDDELPPTSVNDYLSGLLIGEELRSMTTAKRFDCSSPIQIIGAASLCRRYRRAAECFDLAVAGPVADAAAHGLWQIACHTDLSALQPESSRC